jgi:hypothetical protein
MSFKYTEIIKELIKERDPDAVMFYGMSGNMTATELLAYFEKEEQEEGSSRFLKSYTVTLLRSARDVLGFETCSKLKIFRSFTNYFKKQPLYKTGRFYSGDEDSWSFFTDTHQYSVAWDGEEGSYVFQATGADIIRCISFNSAYEKGYNTIEKLYQYLFEGKVDAHVTPSKSKYDLMPNIPEYKEFHIPEVLQSIPKTREEELAYRASLNIKTNKVNFKKKRK